MNSPATRSSISSRAAAPAAAFLVAVFIAAAFIAAALTSPLSAQDASAPQAWPPAGDAARAETDYTATTLVPETDGVAAGQTFWVALRQEVAAGWHVFWENPGDAGLPLDLQWTLPEGFSADPPIHPVPEYFSYGPLANFAHEGAPVFLIRMTAPETLPRDAVAPGGALSFAVRASWQVCEDICVPEAAALSFSLPAADVARPDPRRAALFAAARRALPAPFEGEAVFAATKKGYRLTLEDDAGTLPGALSGANRGDAYFFPAVSGLITPAAPQKVRYRNGVLTVEMARGYFEGHDGDTVRGVLGFVDEGGARAGLDIAASYAPRSASLAGTGSGSGTGAGASPADGPGAGASLPLLFAFAFLGGALLNVMPCVFPIIFVKAAALMQAAGEAGAGERALVRVHGLLYTGGVLAAFVFIGAVLLSLRAGGEQLGWGFHLQSPPVVALSAYVLFLVGLNLAGVFHAGESLAGAGGGLAAKGGRSGAFFTGLLAVVVAAPCLGPLLTAPLGAVLLQPPAIGLSILAAMALGLAAPYLALSFAPGLGRVLPRPGPWMGVMKQALAFPVFAGAAYFLWVFAQQTGGAGLAAALAGAVFLAFAAWLFELSKTSGGARLAAMRAAAALAALAAVAPAMRTDPAFSASGDAVLRHGALRAEPYDAGALAAYRAAGRPVFVDFTAAWCATCQFNKLTIFSSKALAREIEAAGVVVMVADWTLRDPAITEALEAFGASGVPLYAVYDPSGGARVLPLPLTRERLRAALAEALAQGGT